ncbi:MAG: SDR family NAD(P)-dependent oxidoreductase [Bryobacteraceae bacterium]
MQIPSKTAFVTGAASGLGAACARALAAAGASVVIADRDREAGPAQAAAISPEAVFLETDVTDPASVETALSQTRDRFSRIDILVHCAGIAPPGRILSKDGPLPLDAFARVVNVNLIGSFNVSRLAAAAMALNTPDSSGERGVIVLTSSIAAFEGQIGQCAYAASKAGVAGLTLPMARDLARHAIRVVAVAPGIFDTPLLASLPDAARHSLGESVPFPPRLGDPAEFAALVRHIVENPYLNGEVIRLDGALRMAPR